MPEIINSVYDYITTEENNFKLPIDLNGWDWGFVEHIKKAFFYKHSRILTGNTDDKPIKNIIRPILNLQYRTEDIDVKDINIYIDDPDKYDLSFYVKKYYEEVFLKKNNLDDFLDAVNESRIDNGGGLMKDTGKGKPESVPLDTIAFCDQTDMLSGPICIKHFYSPDRLKEFESKGWGSEKNGATISVDDLIVLSRRQKEDDKNNKTAQTPGKYIKIYELHGNLPEKFLNEETDSEEYISQLQIVGFYENKDNKDGKQGVTLFRGKEKKSPFKLSLRDPIHGRALGWGGVEELEDSQVWTTYSQIKFKLMMDAAADTWMQTTDDDFARNQRVYEFSGMKLAVVDEGKTLTQINTFPQNINLFDKYIQDWEMHAQKMGAANDSIMGESPSAGTPFKLQELVTSEAHSQHEFRRGKFIKDIEEVWRDWVLPFIAQEISKDQKFLATLSIDEMQFIADKVVERKAAKLYRAGGLDLNGLEQKKIELREEFMKDNKKFIKWAAGEFKDLPLSLNINIKGKQKNLSLYTDKLVNVFRQIAADRSMLDDPRMAKIFNQILESAGLEPQDFSTYQAPPQLQGQPLPVAQTAPLGDLTNVKQ